MFTNQSGNTVGGDLVGGNKYTSTTNNFTNQSPLARLYERLRTDNQSQPYFAQISEQLQHYCSAVTDGDVRGLEAKLSDSNRMDLIRVATKLKESAAKTVMKYQTSGIAQDILTHILAKLYTEFFLNVTPAIEAGAPRVDVDALISEKVLKPALEMLGDNDLMLTQADLLGLLFFLGGNCHVRWDPC
ncbi:MAG TPA: ABC-three component system protein [Sulfuricella sp.]|nr:ABC-three component system protein [Sulfuricella sp.]